MNITSLFSKVLLITALVFTQNSFAAKNGFRINSDNSVKIAGLQYNSMNAYLSSDYFRSTGKRCNSADKNTRLASTNTDPLMAKSIADCTSTLTKIQAEYDPSVTLTIPVWFHVITNTSGTGFVSDNEITQQIKVLNEDFQALIGTLGANGVNSKIKFTHAGTTRTTNNSWYTDSTADELAYKTALGKNQSKFLNVYTNDASGFLGYAYFPFGSAGSVYDGVVMLHGSIGGRNNGFGIYNQGRTLVHEIGHYLGLHHTFQPEGSCQTNSFNSGDLIVDTNAEASPYYGPSCSVGSINSCGSSDPIANYMDYNVDSCMTNFTNQQVNRMICSTVNYRPSLFSITNNTGTVVPLSLLLDD